MLLLGFVWSEDAELGDVTSVSISLDGVEGIGWLVSISFGMLRSRVERRLSDSVNVSIGDVVSGTFFCFL